MSVVSRNPVIRLALIEARLARCERETYMAGMNVWHLEDLHGGPCPELEAAYAEHAIAQEAERKARRALRKVVTS